MNQTIPYSSVKLLNTVNSFHNVMRFGHTSDVSDFFSDSEREDYVLGLTLVFILLLAFTFVWFLVLLILRFLGARVGCASGRATTIPAETMNDFDKYGDETENSGEFVVMQGDQNRINRIRIMYFTTSILTLLSAGAVIFSVVQIQGSFNDLYGTSSALQSLFSDLSLDAMKETVSEVDAANDLLIAQLSGFCPSSNQKVLGLNPTKLSKDYVKSLSELDDVSSDGTFDDFSSSIDETATMIDNMENFFEFADSPTSWWFISSMILACFTIVGTIYFDVLAWKSGNAGFEFVGEVDDASRGYRCTHYFVTPLFALLAILAWFLASTFLTGAAATADFCHSEISTGEGIQKILEQRGFDIESDEYKIIDSYVHECENEDSVPHDIIDTYSTDLNDAQKLGADFMGLSDDGDISELIAVCGNKSTKVMDLATTAIGHVDNLVSEFESLKSNLSCKSVAPLVQKTVYETTCQNLITNIAWNFSSFLVLAVFMTLLVTMRTAIQRPNIYIVPGQDSATMTSYDGVKPMRDSMSFVPQARGGGHSQASSTYYEDY